MLKFTKHLDEIENRCKGAATLLLLFDFDGTLAPIVEHPDMAELLPGWRERLSALKKDPRVVLGVVTGRAIESIRDRIGIPDIIIASDHGSEVWKGAQLGVKHVGKNSQYLELLAGDVRNEFNSVDGVVIEEKKYSVAIHYRMVDFSIREEVKGRVEELTDEYCKKYDWEKMHGKELIEVRPTDSWNKGDAVRWIQENYAPGSLPIYIGDDTTDEDAFREIGEEGITIRVGKKGDSCAAYYVDSVEDMVPWIGRW